MQENQRLRLVSSAHMPVAAFSRMSSERLCKANFAFLYAMRYFAYRFFYLYFSFYFTKEAQTQGSVQWAR